MYLDMTPNTYQTMLLEALAQATLPPFDLHLVLYHDLPEDEAYRAIMSCLSRVKAQASVIKMLSEMNNLEGLFE